MASVPGSSTVFVKMNISGGGAWGQLFSHLSSVVEVDYNGEKTTLPAIRGLAESDDKEVRRAAYEAELACYDKIKGSLAILRSVIRSRSRSTASRLRSTPRQSFADMKAPSL